MSCIEEILHIQQCIENKIIGQQNFVERLLIALLADGHILVEGAPGLAKTKAVRELSYLLEGDFHRVQFTPDLLPADLTGTEIYRPQDGSFNFQPGPLFHNLILADEINRAPAKVQSALLEAMAEQQITVGKKSYPLPSLFFVMATQNPIEQEGTYPLPEAQLDRFIMHIEVNYPKADAEKTILQLNRKEALSYQGQNSTAPVAMPILKQETIFQARREILQLHMSDEVEQYLINLVLASREPQKYSPQLAQWIAYGASPRATIALDRCARAHAWLNKRDFVTPADIQSIAADVLRHRILLSFEAEASNISINQVISELMQQVACP